MPPEPYYMPNRIRSAYQLRYTWTGWPKRHRQFPPRPQPPFFDTIAERWEEEGLRPLDIQWSPTKITILISAKPTVSPIFMAQSLKGRLYNGLRHNNTPTRFSRKFSVTTVGQTRRHEVEAYIERQVQRSDFASSPFKARLSAFTTTIPQVDLSTPSQTCSSRYWYNLHLVLVVDGRFRISDDERLNDLHQGTLRIAKVKRDRISTISVMPDHLHVALRPNIERSPEDTALSYMNNLGHLLGVKALWQPSYYVGTFGEYDMNALNCRSASGSDHRGDSTIP